LVPGLVAVMDAASVESLIEKAPNDARYFVGLMAWPPAALDEEVRSGAWLVLPADANTALPANSSGLWKSMEGTEV
jgi:putative AlgH/UPF0301 family transcriptional regulator